MIIIDETTPRWIRELDRFIYLKSLLFIHGNTLDLVAYPVKNPETGQTYWTEGDLSTFFQRYLHSLGYEIIGLFDPIDGLNFMEEDMEKWYRDLAAGKPVDRKQQSDREKTHSSHFTPSPKPASGFIDFEPILDKMNIVLQNREIPTAFIINFTSRLINSPEQLTTKEQTTFTRVLKAAMQSREVLREDVRLTNGIILICDKLNDLPPFLYLNNPRSRAILIDKPDAGERTRFIKVTYPSFYQSQGEPPPEVISQFSMLTEGFSYYEMLSLIGLSLRESIPIDQVRHLCERYKYGITDSAWDKLDKYRLDQAHQLIRQRIKGQEAAVARVLEIIKRAKLGIAAGTQPRSQRPRGVLFFAGPTGVGKTEMAKSLAELLFGDENRLIRFDMSEYAAQNADQRLLGAPPGYVGYETGGQLTNAVKANPFSVLLFDEIEKAYPNIFDKFLQILDDGRFTDGRGETVYFSECIIIFTSNLGTVSSPQENAQRRQLVTPELSYPQMSEVMLKAIYDHFNFTLGRPEILNRFGDSFVVFDFIRPPLDEQIVDMLLKHLIQSLAEQRDIHLRLTKTVREILIKLAREHLEHGGRGIRNVIDRALVNPLASALFDKNIQKGTVLRLVKLVDQGASAVQRFTVELKTESESSS